MRTFKHAVLTFIFLVGSYSFADSNVRSTFACLETLLSFSDFFNNPNVSSTVGKYTLSGQSDELNALKVMRLDIDSENGDNLTILSTRSGVYRCSYSSSLSASDFEIDFKALSRSIEEGSGWGERVINRSTGLALVREQAACTKFDRAPLDMFKDVVSVFPQLYSSLLDRKAQSEPESLTPGNSIYQPDQLIPSLNSCRSVSDDLRRRIISKGPGVEAIWNARQQTNNAISESIESGSIE